MNPAQLQATLFEKIKSAMDDNISMVDEVAELLNVSSDSAYRRIRGEKIIPFDELLILAGKYGISLDEFLGIDGKQLPFHYSNLSTQGGEVFFLDLIQNLQHQQIAFSDSALPLLDSASKYLST